MKLSKNFTLSEFEASSTARSNDIDNSVDPKSAFNLQLLVDNCLQPIRDKFELPIQITSGFRCEELNKLVGGSPRSHHLTGQAVDFQILGVDKMVVLEWIRDNLQFCQLIDEYSKSASWIHLSYVENDLRNQLLTVDKKNQIRATGLKYL